MLQIPHDALRRAAASAGPVVVDLSCDAGGIPVNCKLTTRPGATALLILFHGAVDLKTRTPPIFMRPSREMLETMHCLSIADPSIRPGLDINIAWYAGDRDFETRRHLPQVIGAVSDALGISRRIYHGASAGGFAALLHSHGDPDGVAVVLNPQTDIEAYNEFVLRRYRARVWPDLPADQPLSTVIQSNVCDLYRQGAANRVIYLQSLGDRAHYRDHALPFMAAVAQARIADRVYLQADFWGEMGHRPIPAEKYATWLRAVALSPKLDAESLLTLRHQLQQASVAAPRAQAVPGKARGFDPADLQISTLLAGFRKGLFNSRKGKG